MGAGLPDFVVVNLADLDKLEAGVEVSLDSVKEQILSVSGREAGLPLKVFEGSVACHTGRCSSFACTHATLPKLSVCNNRQTHE